MDHTLGRCAPTAEVGSRLRRYRRLRGLTLAEVGACIGVSAQQVHKYERGANEPPRQRLVSIAAALGIEPDWLTGRDTLPMTIGGGL